MAQIHYIKDLYENEDLSMREIARRVNSGAIRPCARRNKATVTEI